MSNPRKKTYEGAPESLIALWDKRRRALGFAPGETLAALDSDLAALAGRIVPPPPSVANDASRNAQKEGELRRDLAGQSELVLLHALVISHLRKRRFPPHAPALFHRMWREQSPALMAQLSTRWMISAVITFGDHGETSEQKMLGREMGMLFSLMKLYEFERLYSGLAPDQPFALKARSTAALPLEMPSFALASGGLDINLLAPLWQRAQDIPVLGPLACHLLDQLNTDAGTLFRRISLMREKRQAHRKAIAEKT